METISRTHWGERIIVNMVHILQRYAIIKFNSGNFNHAAFKMVGLLESPNTCWFSGSPFHTHLIIFNEDNALIKATHCFSIG